MSTGQIFWLTHQAQFASIPGEVSAVSQNQLLAPPLRSRGFLADGADLASAPFSIEGRSLCLDIPSAETSSLFPLFQRDFGQDRSPPLARPKIIK